MTHHLGDVTPADRVDGRRLGYLRLTRDWRSAERDDGNERYERKKPEPCTAWPHVHSLARGTEFQSTVFGLQAAVCGLRSSVFGLRYTNYGLRTTDYRHDHSAPFGQAALSSSLVSEFDVAGVDAGATDAVRAPPFGFSSAFRIVEHEVLDLRRTRRRHTGRTRSNRLLHYGRLE